MLVLRWYYGVRSSTVTEILRQTVRFKFELRLKQKKAKDYEQEHNLLMVWNSGDSAFN
jgi:hypothetical protein